jgi:hypothetical protein
MRSGQAPGAVRAARDALNMARGVLNKNPPGMSPADLVLHIRSRRDRWAR